jgi:hypothetical protein
MIEFDLPEDHPLVINLNKMLLWVRSSDVPDKVVGEQESCGLTEEETLHERIAAKIANKCLMSRFDDHKDYDFSDIQKHSAKLYEEKMGIKYYATVPVAKTWYPPNGGYLGWHIDLTGDRIYSAWAEGESFFRYRDPETGEVITSWDKPKQWSFRIFTFDEKNPMWHCVYAKDLRVSIGYRFIRTGPK